MILTFEHDLDTVWLKQRARYFDKKPLRSSDGPDTHNRQITLPGPLQCNDAQQNGHSGEENYS